MGKLLKTGAMLLSVVGGAAGVVTSVNQVVESYQYNNIHEITITDVYIVNGQEVDGDTFYSYLNNMNAVADVKTQDCTVIGEESVELFYGAVDKYTNIDFAKLNYASYDHMYANFTATISAGNVDAETAQYPVFVFPAEYELTKWESNGFALSFGSYELGDYEIAYLKNASYDEDAGGITYTLYFK